MFSFLWILAGTAAYLIVAFGLYTKIGPDRTRRLLFLAAALAFYIPFVGFPFFTAESRLDNTLRESAETRIDLLKRSLKIIDSGTGRTKEDRYLNVDEIGRLFEAVMSQLPAVSGAGARVDAGTAIKEPYICDYLYLYAYLMAHPQLTVAEKWDITQDMPRRFYRPDPALPATTATRPSDLSTEVRAAWRVRLEAVGAKMAPGACPAPP